LVKGINFDFYIDLFDDNWMFANIPGLMDFDRKEMKFLPIILVFAITFNSFAQKASIDRDLPKWIFKTGARKLPQTEKIYSANAFGAKGDGTTNSTKAIQRAIDEASKKGGVVDFDKGVYLTGALFVKSNVHLRVDEGVTLTASQDEGEYPRKPTRVAGIEMEWMVALINVENAKNVRISGTGTIDGNGQKWWDKYWNLRKEYEPKGLRWASDYDAERVRLMLISDSSDVTVENVSLKRSGFWTVQVLYSEYITVDGIKISDNGGPSTDGVDVDSSRYVLIQNCDIDNNDDDICLKAGRDFVRPNIFLSVTIQFGAAAGSFHSAAKHRAGFVTLLP
jgi:polygalacturonase